MGWKDSRCKTQTCDNYTLCGKNGIINLKTGNCTSKDGDPWKCTCNMGYTGTFCTNKTCNGTTFCKNAGI